MPECRGCQAQITFARNPATGKNIPLQKVTTYEVDWKKETDPVHGHEVDVATAIKVEREIYISHFLTCPAANKFSGGGR